MSTSLVGVRPTEVLWEPVSVTRMDGVFECSLVAAWDSASVIEDLVSAMMRVAR